MIDRKQRTLTDEDIKEIADTFKRFRNGEDVSKLGVYKVATIEEIEKENFILTPGRFVGIVESEEEQVPFKEKMEELIQNFLMNLLKIIKSQITDF